MASRRHATNQEDKRNSRRAESLTVARGLRKPKQDCDDQEANKLAERRQHHEPAAAHALHQQNGEACKDHVRDRIASCQKASGALLQFDCFFHDRRQIVAHDIDAPELLHELASCTEQQSSKRFGIMLLALDQVSPADAILALVSQSKLDFIPLGDDKWIVLVFRF